MVVVFLSVGILVLVLGLVFWFILSRKKAKGMPLNTGVVSPVDAGRGKFKPPKFPGKNSLDFSFRPPQPLKEGAVKAPEEGEDKNSFSSRVTVLSSAVPPAAVPLPSAPKDFLVDEKLVLKDDEIRQLQQEVVNIREKADERVRHSLDVLNKLHEENDRLQSDVDRFRAEGAKSSGDAEVLNRLREENVELKAQLEAASQSQKDFHEQVEILRREFEGQLARARETVARLEKENLEVGSSSQKISQPEKVIDGVREEYPRQIEQLRLEIDALQRDNAALKAAQALQGAKQEDALSGGHLHDLEQANNSLQEKNKFLQYELTKSRAQASGFERICEGSKKRLEDMAGDIRSLEQEKESFRHKVDELEKSLSAFKSAPGPINPEGGASVSQEGA